MSAKDDVSPKAWALAYAAAGFSVMPVWWKEEDPEAPGGWTCACLDHRKEETEGAEPPTCDRPAKHPIPKQSVKHATTDPAAIAAWWDKYPQANIGIASGERSQCIVIDVDCGGDKAGDVAITEACAQSGGVPPTASALTGSGGRHYIYAWRKNPYTRKIGFLKHVDYLSDGGYFIAHPSENMKGEYTWDPALGITRPGDVKKLRAAMQDLPEWFDKLEGQGRSGRKSRSRNEDSERRTQERARSRIVNAASIEFRPENPAAVRQLREALTHVDPDSRDLWVLFGIILGRAFERSDDGWTVYSEWAARSEKFADQKTEAYMRSYYYTESQQEPQSGSPATVATIFRAAIEAGWTPPPGGMDERPVIAYRPGRALETIDALLRQLSIERESAADRANPADDLRVYSYGSTLGSIIRTHDTAAHYDRNSGEPPNGWPLAMMEYSPMNLGSRLTQTVTMVKFAASGGATQVECPPEVSNLLLTRYANRFPRLNGIVQWPLVKDGRVLGFEEEYDAATGLFFCMPRDLDLSGLQGTRAEAEAAWKWVREEALSGFPFGTERDAAAALGMLLTFMQRRAMRTAPAWMVAAPIQGSGKTALVQMASRAVQGRGVAASAWSRGGEENRKALTAQLMTNPPCVLFDNLPEGSRFNSEELAIATTSDEWEDRVLGESRKARLPNRAVWCFTGNNVTLRSDLRRRFVTIRMVPLSKRHWTKTFARELNSWSIDNRNKMLTALVSIALWASAGGADVPELRTGSGFPEWDVMVRRAVLAITGQDIFDAAAADDEEEDDTEAAALAIAVSWGSMFGDEPNTVRTWREKLLEQNKSADPDRKRRAVAAEEAVASLRGVPPEKLTAEHWGEALRALMDRTLPIGDSDRYAHFNRAGLHRGKVALWKLVHAGDLIASVGSDF